MRLLLVEDDPMVGEAVSKGLGREGFALDWVRDGRAAELALDTGVYDLLLLDLGLPRKDGVEVLRGLRRKGSAIPTLILTARDSVDDRVKGLDSGADDYLVKPFDLNELAARVRALLRRRAGRGRPDVEHGRLRLDPASHEAFWNGEPVSVSPREFSLLLALLETPGAVLSREQIEERLYGWEEVESNAVEVHIHNLRRKLGAGAIRNVRGVGWKIGPCT
ncbi:MAG TPA: response regulator transcription factor [Burkholderiales bacterium]|nr:response regulator transcription factor [Burkholderiales bacterium]